jgi:hypothetical protein
MNISSLLSDTNPPIIPAPSAPNETPATGENKMKFLGRVGEKSSTLQTIIAYTPNILPPSLSTNLDRFACDQLDKLEHILTPPSASQNGSEYTRDYTIQHTQPPANTWTSVVTNVPSNIGAIVISDDLLKGLKYCLTWIESAKLHIDDQISLLRSYMQSYMSSEIDPSGLWLRVLI